MIGYTKEELRSFITSFREAALIEYRKPVLVQQRATALDRGVRGPRWVSKTVFPAPDEDDARQILLTAIQDLGNGSENYIAPSRAAVPAQWVAYRPGVTDSTPEPPMMTERDKFDALDSAVNNNDGMTIMYMVGGAQTLNGPALRRGTATIMSRLTNARCVIIQHRLAPQSPFPSQLLDILHAYLSLLYPPPGSFHKPVDSTKLLLVGDSSGALLALSLLQIILTTQRRTPDQLPSLQFHGRTVQLRLPAGVAVQSPCFDHICSSLPSWDANWPDDLFPSFPPPPAWPDFPYDAAWPTTPPRVHMYAPLPMMTHPLISPMLARDWTGAPPLYLAVGGKDVLLDSARVLAQRAARQGVPVIWEEYEQMPHIWPMLLPTWPQSVRCMDTWAAACVAFVRGSKDFPITTRGCFVEFEPDAEGQLPERPIDVHHLIEISDHEIETRIRRRTAQFEAASRGERPHGMGKL